MLFHYLSSLRQFIPQIDLNHLARCHKWTSMTFLSIFLFLFIATTIYSPASCTSSASSENVTFDLVDKRCMFDNAVSDYTIESLDSISLSIYMGSYFYLGWILMLTAFLFTISPIFWNLRHPNIVITMSIKKLTMWQKSNRFDETDNFTVERLHGSIVHPRQSTKFEFIYFVFYCHFVLLLQVLSYDFALNHNFITLAYRWFSDGLSLESVFKSNVECVFKSSDGRKQLMDCDLSLSSLYAFIYLLMWLIYLMLFIITTICTFNLLNFLRSNSLRRINRIAFLLPLTQEQERIYFAQRDRFFVIESLALKLKPKAFASLIGMFVAKYSVDGVIEVEDSCDCDFYDLEEMTSLAECGHFPVAALFKNNIQSRLDQYGNLIRLPNYDIDLND